MEGFFYFLFLVRERIAEIPCASQRGDKTREAIEETCMLPRRASSRVGPLGQVMGRPPHPGCCVLELTTSVIARGIYGTRGCGTGCHWRLCRRSFPRPARRYHEYKPRRAGTYMEGSTRRGGILARSCHGCSIITTWAAWGVGLGGGGGCNSSISTAANYAYTKR